MPWPIRQPITLPPPSVPLTILSPTSPPQPSRWHAGPVVPGLRSVSLPLPPGVGGRECDSCRPGVVGSLSHRPSWRIRGTHPGGGSAGDPGDSGPSEGLPAGTGLRRLLERPGPPDLRRINTCASLSCEPTGSHLCLPLRRVGGNLAVVWLSGSAFRGRGAPRCFQGGQSAMHDSHFSPRFGVGEGRERERMDRGKWPGRVVVVELKEGRKEIISGPRGQRQGSAFKATSAS